MGLLSNPASRLAALIAVVAIGVALSGVYPSNRLNSKAAINTDTVKFIHLLFVAASVGVGNWTTFVFGLVAFKNLPRRIFGNLQARLFPWYFRVLTLSQAIALLTHITLHSGKQHRDMRSTGVLIVALVCSLLNLLFIEPATTATMFKRHVLENDHGEADQAALKQKPEYKQISKKFGMLHGLSSLANLIGLGAVHVHLWYLASKLRF
jgi:NAD/NADP transhydrogenase beta subunit